MFPNSGLHNILLTPSPSGAHPTVTAAAKVATVATATTAGDQKIDMSGMSKAELMEARSCGLFPSQYAEAKSHLVSPQQYALFLRNNLTLYDCVSATQIGKNLEEYKLLLSEEDGANTEYV